MNTKALTRKGLTRGQMRGYSIVPMVSPFTAQGELDEGAARRVAEHIIGGGCQGLLIAGTNGECASMTPRMRLRLAELALDQVGGRGVIFGGIADNSFAHTIQLARDYFRAGADAVVAHLPSYYPLNAQEMESYFRTLADRVEGPLYLYNIPQTTRHSVPLEVIERLSHHPRIAGVKDSEPDAARQEQLARMFAGRADFVVFCGMVAATCRAMRAGADGFVPSAGNLAPGAARELMNRLVAGDRPGADAAQQRLDAISVIYQKGRIITQQLAVLKGALSLLGLCEPHVLPPLPGLNVADLEQTRGQMCQLALLP